MFMILAVDTLYWPAQNAAFKTPFNLNTNFQPITRTKKIPILKFTVFLFEERLIIAIKKSVNNIFDT